jgi:hypothetical protein
MESAFPIRARRKVGFPAIVQQAGAGRKYRIKREACALQSHSSEKSDVEICGPSWAEMLRRDIQRLNRIMYESRKLREHLSPNHSDLGGAFIGKFSVEARHFLLHRVRET